MNRVLLSVGSRAPTRDLVHDFEEFSEVPWTL